MRVRCVANSGADLPDVCIDASLGISREKEFPLTIGSSYAVYAITTFKGSVWYYVFDDNELAYPVWRLAPLFEVGDPSLPDTWVYGYIRKDPKEVGFPLISFPEWALDHSFYERLVDGDEQAVTTFAMRKVEIEGAQ